jgi:hypothetical protein
MSTRSLLVPGLLAGLLAPLTAPLTAQWPTSSGTNLAIADFTGEQVVNKIATTSDGGAWLGWFDQRGGSYAVYVQRLDAAGVEQFAHGGILASNNPQSTSLVDWDLICDSLDFCVLTFTDTRAGGDLDVYAYRIADNGAMLWGPNGVTLSNNGDFEANPRVCEASNGDFVFTWANSVLKTVQVQRLDQGGTPSFAGDGLAIPGDVGASPGFVRVAAADNGAVILSWVRTTAFSGNKHVHMQKVDALGNQLWNGGTRIAVFDGGSVPIAHEPRLLPDGSGGAICAWHFAAGSLFSVRVQHVLANGTEDYPHNGVDVSTSANSKFDPALVWQPSLPAALVVWNERNVAQTTWGIFAQRIDSGGTLGWGNGGVQVRAIDTIEKFAPVAAAYGSFGVSAAVLETSLGAQQRQVTVFGLDNTGTALFPPTAASTVPSDKLRLGIAATPSGTSVVSWTDKRTDGGDVFLHALDAGGGSTITLASAVPYGCGVNPPGSLVAVGRPAIGMESGFLLSNPLGTQAAGLIGAVFLCVQAAPGLPCGVVVPGFGMAGPGANGEILVDIGQPNLALAGTYGGPGTMMPVSYALPLDKVLLGLPLYAQGAVIDLAPGTPMMFGVSNGLLLTLGS